MKNLLRRSLAVLAVAVTAGSLTTVATPASAATTWLYVSSGYNHTCGITTRRDLYCWGRNRDGQLGTAPLTLPDTTTPTLMIGWTDDLFPDRGGNIPSTWLSVSPGVYHTCGIAVGGSLYCWAGTIGGNWATAPPRTGAPHARSTSTTTTVVSRPAVAAQAPGTSPPRPAAAATAYGFAEHLDVTRPATSPRAAL